MNLVCPTENRKIYQYFNNFKNVWNIMNGRVYN